MKNNYQRVWALIDEAMHVMGTGVHEYPESVSFDLRGMSVNHVSGETRNISFDTCEHCSSPAWENDQCYLHRLVALKDTEDE